MFTYFDIIVQPDLSNIFVISIATPCRIYFSSFNISNIKRATLALGIRLAVD